MICEVVADFITIEISRIVRIGDGLIRPKPAFGAWVDLSVPSQN
jgi:hypothetical protein